MPATQGRRGREATNVLGMQISVVLREAVPDGGLESVALGEAVQVEPMKSKLKVPGTERLILKCDDLLSVFAYISYLRR